MDRAVFIKRLETYQCSSAPIDVITKAIDRLKEEFYGSNYNERDKQILNHMIISSADLKASELY
ncbi:MAG: hypothetical protein U9N59_04405 [Campylobacterota bacterium]|nr:hypothetical protein [Campylobacterota bacterium]